MLNIYGTVSYNGYQFPGTYNTSIRMETEYSSDGLNPKWDRYELTVQWIHTTELNGAHSKGALIPGNNNAIGSVDDQVEQLRALLMAPRGPLVYANQGYGNFYVDGSNPTAVNFAPDVGMGPKPQSFEFEPIGTHRAVACTWIVQFFLPPCSAIRSGDALTVNNPFLELYYKRDFNITDAGHVEITTTGYAELRSAYTNIDANRFQLYFRPPVGLVREVQSYTIETDHRTLRFRMVDKELPSTNAALPIGAVKIDASHTMQSKLKGGGSTSGKGFISWDNDFSATVTLANRVKPEYAYYVFLFLLRQRMLRVFGDGIWGPGTAKATQNTKDEKGVNQTQQPRVVLTKLSATENIFSNQHSFKASYLGLYARDALLAQSGLFRPMHMVRQDTQNLVYDWIDWTNGNREPWHRDYDDDAADMSLQEQWVRYQQWLETQPTGAGANLRPVASTYGMLYIREKSSDTPSLIFTPCGALNAPFVINPLQENNALSYHPPYGEVNVEDHPVPKPNKETGGDEQLDVTYLDYKTRFTVVERSRTYQLVKQNYNAAMTKAVKGNGTAAGWATPKTLTGYSVNTLSDTEGNEANYESNKASSYSSVANTMLVFSGYAVRVGHPAPIPTILSYDGSEVIKAEEAIYSQGQAARSDFPVYITAWSIPYYIDKEITGNIFAKLSGYHSNGLLT